LDILTFRIVELPPMRVAFRRALGANSEAVAWQEVLAWCHRNGLLRPEAPPRLFGYDSRSPERVATPYGYEAWVLLAGGFVGDGRIAVRQAPGGLYAGLRTLSLRLGWEWGRAHLDAWMDANGYSADPARSWLEEHILNPASFARYPRLSYAGFDILLPIRPAP
jgi:hypothetical protein